ncbi:MAG TPA: MFS transporter [Vicinamibacterales bacterium]|nr:MFS transporter [Vicinamibacterales bacterium]
MSVQSVLSRLGLGTGELRAWAMYDWANSAFYTTIVAAVFPIYFHSVVAGDLPGPQATSRFAWATTIAILIVAVVAPLLGAIADFAGLKKRFLAIFMGMGVLSATAMYWLTRGDWLLALVLFVIGNVGVAASVIFYESLLPHLVEESELDRVSSAGYAIGYLGGGVLLAINLLMIQRPTWFGIADPELAVRLSLASVGIWWLVFAVPLFLYVPEPARRIEAGERPAGSVVAAGARRLLETLQELRRYRQAFLLLLAFVVYNDGIQTIIRMASTYGTEIGIDQSALIAALLITQFTGVPFAFLFGYLAGRVGAKTAVFGGLAVYAGITVLGYFMQTATHFFVLAILVGMVQGGTQALSRSLFASMIPRHKSSEFFAFFGVFERYAGVLGPLIFATMVEATGSSRNAILAVIAFFVVGGGILAFVNVEEGRAAARLAEADVTTIAQRAGGTASGPHP